MDERTEGGERTPDTYSYGASEKKSMRRIHWTVDEQKKEIGTAVAIAATANLLLGLQRTEKGKEYTNWMVTHAEMDERLRKPGIMHLYILIPMLPFAVELCLKVIRSQGGNEFIRTHNLDTLWKDLDETEQAGIRKRVEDPSWRNKARTRRKALGITGAMRTIDQVIEFHQCDFERWRYVVDGEKSLTKEKKEMDIEEAIMDLFGIVDACVDYYKSRDAQQP